ncbi:MAG: 50S ribosomal protein L4 [Candidatus Competibacterales bacterium]
MELPIRQRGAESGSAATVTVADAVFDRAFNETLVHQIVTAYLAAGRAGTRGQKNRTAVSGGGSKPWRQKGTGRARAGTIRSPLWRGGGVTFAAKPQDYRQKVNRKMYRAALQAILSELHRQERLMVVSDLTVDAPKTKAMVALMADLALEGRVLLVSEAVDDNLFLASRNLVGVQAIDVEAVDPVSLVAASQVVMTVEALKRLEARLS